MSESMALAKREQLQNGLRAYLATKKDAIKAVLPSSMNTQRFLVMAMGCVSRNPALLECEPNSFYLGLLACAEMGLEPSGLLGHVALVPYKGIVTVQPMYQGLLELVRRSGEVTQIFAFAVHEGDHFKYTLGLRPNIEHEPAEDNDDSLVTHVYAVAQLKDGGVQFAVMSRKEVDKIRSRSRASSGPWQTDWEQMALKTVIKRLCKMLPKSIELQSALTADNAAETGRPTAPIKMTELTPDEVTILESTPEERESKCGPSKAIQAAKAQSQQPSPKSPAAAAPESSAANLEADDIAMQCSWCGMNMPASLVPMQHDVGPVCSKMCFDEATRDMRGRS